MIINRFFGALCNIFQLRNMEFGKQSVAMMLLFITFLTTSKAMDMVWKTHADDSVEEIARDPSKKPLIVPLNLFMGDHMNANTDHSTGKPNDQLPIPTDDHAKSTIEESVDEIPAFNDDNDGPASEETGDATDILTDDSMENPMTDSADDYVVIHIQPEPKIFSMQIREFHECVSCNADDGARKIYGQCLQFLSFEHQEIIKSCCNISFDTDFCNKAKSGNIDYGTICQDPKKALKVGDCFWLNVEDKNTDDIQKYRECKKQILDSYCTVRSSENDLDKKVVQA